MRKAEEKKKRKETSSIPPRDRECSRPNPIWFSASFSVKEIQATCSQAEQENQMPSLRDIDNEENGKWEDR